MSKEQQYREMLDGCNTGEMFANYSNATILEAVDPVAYRCGMNDFQAACDHCGDETWNDDDESGECYCSDCAESRCTECGAFPKRFDHWEGRTPVLCDDCGGVDPEEPKEEA